MIAKALLIWLLIVQVIEIGYRIFRSKGSQSFTFTAEGDAFIAVYNTAILFLMIMFLLPLV